MGDDLTYLVLSGLARTGPCSAVDLGREVGLDRTTVSRRADGLERSGLLKRQLDPDDSRATPPCSPSPTTAVPSRPSPGSDSQARSWTHSPPGRRPTPAPSPPSCAASSKRDPSPLTTTEHP
ncbi:MarR family transcriptional regulator [Streptomyces sp. NPDC055085]